MMHATRPPASHPGASGRSPGPHAGRANGDANRAADGDQRDANEEISGTSGPVAPRSPENLPAAPASDPPASLDAPIDDVDGVLE